METNINFLLDLARHPEFASGNVHINFIKENHKSLFKFYKMNDTQLIQAALGVVLWDEFIDFERAIEKKDQFNPFVIESGFRINHNLIRDVKLKTKDQGTVLKIAKMEIKIFFSEITVKIKYLDRNVFHMSLDGGNSWRIIQGQLRKKNNGFVLRNSINSVITSVNIFLKKDSVTIFDMVLLLASRITELFCYFSFFQSGKREFHLEEDLFLLKQFEDNTFGHSSITSVSPMPGVLDKILVNTGDTVKKGDSLFILIAMKMEHVVKANRDGVISDVLFNPGDYVMKDAVVVKFQEEESLRQNI